MTDKEFDDCMQRIKTGDKDALKDIYNDYIAYIYTCVYSVVKNKENAEDITSDFFLKLWDIAGRYIPGNGHKTWLVRIAHNMSIDFLRKRKRESLSDTMEDAMDGNLDEGKASIYDGVHDSSPVEAEAVSNMFLEQALSTLEEGERDVINMKIICDMTFKDIAIVLGVSMGTVTWKYQSAMKKLRRCGYE